MTRLIDRPRVVAPLAFVLLIVCARPARADWLMTPFVGMTFAGDTTFLLPETGARTKQFILGGAGGWLSDAGVGAEVDYAYGPRFFEGGSDEGVITTSSLHTLMFNGIAALPLSVTRESLRPYVSAGLGLIRSHSEDIRSFYTLDESLLGVNIGGGAIGFVGRRTGVRFDIRHFRTPERDDAPLSNTRGTRLKFWRATFGVTLRY